MNLKSFENIDNHIEVEDSRERKEILLEKIEQISLVYADKKFKEKENDNKNYKFSEAIKEFTPVENIISQRISEIEGINLSEYKKKADPFLKDFYNEVDSVYKVTDSNLNDILELIDLKKNSIKNYLGIENLKKNNEESKKVKTKVLRFNKITNIETFANEKYKNLEDFGFSKYDHFVEIHFKDFYDTNEKFLGLDLIKNDLGVMAEYIIDKEPEAAAVVGKSWLLNARIATNLGFETIDDETIKQNDLSTWLQFIDKNGQISQKRINKFFLTGELPFKSVEAFISTETFLKKYLPNDRRGKIILKEIDKSKSDFWFDVQNKLLSIMSNWDDLLKNKGDFEDFIKNNKVFELAKSVIPGNENEYIDFLKEMYEKRIPWINFFSYKSENMKILDKKISDGLYKEKEIFIEQQS